MILQEYSKEGEIEGVSGEININVSVRALVAGGFGEGIGMDKPWGQGRLGSRKPALTVSMPFPLMGDCKRGHLQTLRRLRKLCSPTLTGKQ